MYKLASMEIQCLRKFSSVKESNANYNIKKMGKTDKIKEFERYQTTNYQEYNNKFLIGNARWGNKSLRE